MVKHRTLGKITNPFEAAIKIIEIIEQYGKTARLAGGCVRDRLLGLEPSDYDIATSALPPEVLDVGRQHHIKMIPTGIEHGTVTAVVGSWNFEITSIRQDVATDGRRAVVAFGSDYQQDAARRDFTINAMYEDQHGQIFDYFGGKEDLKHNRLVFVNDPSLRIKEDYLRILRYFRFLARFQGHADKATLAAIASLVEGLEKISQERKTSELLKILGYQGHSSVLELMLTTGVLRQIWPNELPLPDLPSTLGVSASLEDVMPVDRLPISRLAWLWNMSLNPAENTVNQILSHVEFLSREWRLSTKQSKDIAAAIIGLRYTPPQEATQADLLMFLNEQEGRGGPQSLEEWLIPFWLHCIPLSGKPIIEILADLEKNKGHLRKSRCPISAKVIIETMHLPPGPQVGHWLRVAQQAFYNEEFATFEQGLLWLTSKAK